MNPSVSVTADMKLRPFPSEQATDPRIQRQVDVAVDSIIADIEISVWDPGEGALESHFHRRLPILSRVGSPNCLKRHVVVTGSDSDADSECVKQLNAFRH